MKRPRRILLATLLLVPTEGATADVLDVRGPSPDHTEIKNAVAAAQDGDVIRIWPGTYQAFWIEDKSLTLVNASSSGTVTVNGTYRVKNLSPGTSVEISGIGATGTDGYALVVSDCQGSVRIREGTFHGADAPGGSPYNGMAAVFVLQCDDVEMTDCLVEGGYAAVGEDGGIGGDGLNVEGSRLSLYNSTFVGADGTTDDDPGANGWGGGYGILAWGGGRTYISGCTLIGGNGGAADPELSWWTGEYGWGGNGGDSYCCWDLSTEAWFLDNDLQPGLGGWSPDPLHFGYDGHNPTTGTFLPGEARLMQASRLVDDQSTIALCFRGSPGDLVTLRLASSPDYTFDPFAGPYLLHTPALSMQAIPWAILGTIDGSGQFTTTLPVRDLPPLGHLTQHLQGKLIGSERYFTSSSWTVILDTAW